MSVHHQRPGLQQRPLPWLTCCVGLIVSGWLPATVGWSADRPNIIYIMSDDMGYSDIGCYGSEIATPHLNQLAAHGLRFTQFYNMGRCCPTRACLLTGLYPHQAGIGHMMSDRGYDGYRGELNRECVTIAEVLKTAGYRTYMSGKWHVTQAVRPKSPAEQHNWPCQRGFDRFYGTIHGAGSFFDPNSLARDNQLISPQTDSEYQPENGFYYTDAISDQAARFVREHHVASGDQPFFMYVSYTAAHWPMHARDEDIEKYSGRYDAGYEAIRAARYQKMIDLQVIDPAATVNWPLDPSWMETEYLEWDIRNMEVYAAMIDRMDQGIGRVIEALRDTEQLENTLVLFFQDNGGCAENYGRSGTGTPRAEQPTLEPLDADHLQVDMQPKQTRDGYPVRTGKGVMAGAADTYIGYGKGWATVSNTPFREYKHWVHEGGIATPLIAHWPRTIQNKGELVHTPAHLIDLMATAVDLAEAEYPDTFHDGQTIQPMEGTSLQPAFGGDTLEREALYWEHEGNRAVRVGDYKLVAKGAKGAWELYNIAADRSEQHDLAEEQPEKAQQMADMFQAYAERARVLPLNPNPPEKFKKNKLRFALKQSANLNRNQAPYVVERGLRFRAQLSEVADGVLVAQGGKTHGWSLYIRNQKLHFARSRAGQLFEFSSPTTISGAGQAEVVWQADQSLRLRWNGRDLAHADQIQLLDEQPAEGLQIGRDEGASVGSYEASYPYPGQISNAVIRLLKP